jgi:hypothetical protein
MARHNPDPAFRKVAFHDMEIGTADPAGLHPDKHLCVSRDGDGNLLHPERVRPEWAHPGYR